MVFVHSRHSQNIAEGIWILVEMWKFCLYGREYPKGKGFTSHWEWKKFYKAIWNFWTIFSIWKDGIQLKAIQWTDRVIGHFVQCKMDNFLMPPNGEQDIGVISFFNTYLYYI